MNICSQSSSVKWLVNDKSIATTVDTDNNPTVLVLHPFCPFCALEEVSGDEKASLEILNILIRLYSSSDIRRVSPDCEAFLDTMKKEASQLVESLLLNGTIDTAFLKDQLTKRLVEDVMPQHGYVAHISVEATTNTDNSNVFEAGARKTLEQLQTLLPTLQSDAVRQIIQQDIQTWTTHLSSKTDRFLVLNQPDKINTENDPVGADKTERKNIIKTIDNLRSVLHLSAAIQLFLKLNEYAQRGRAHCIMIPIHGGITVTIEALSKLLYEPVHQGPSKYLRTLHYNGSKAITTTNDEHAEAMVHGLRTLSTIVYNNRDAANEICDGQHGIVNLVFDVMKAHKENEQVQEAVVELVSHLCIESGDIRADLIRSGLAESIVSVLEKYPDTKAHSKATTLCLIAVANTIDTNSTEASFVKTIIKRSGVGFLVDVLKRASTEDSSSMDVLFRKGLVRGLVSLFQIVVEEDPSFSLHKIIDMVVSVCDTEDQSVCQEVLQTTDAFNVDGICETNIPTDLPSLEERRGTPLHCQLLWITLMASTCRKNAKALFESEEAVKLLASVRPNDAIEMEVFSKAMSFVLVDDWDTKATPLHVASKGGRLHLAELIIENGAVLDAQDSDRDTPLILAARYCHLAIVKLLLEKGAAVDVVNTYSLTALHCASQEGHVEIVKLLTEKGAPLEAQKNTGCTPASCATKNGHLAVVKVLLEKGASLDCRDSEGWGLLQHACPGGHLELMRFLVDKGLSVNKRYYGRSSVLRLAKINGHRAVVDFLKSKGAVEW